MDMKVWVAAAHREMDHQMKPLRPRLSCRGPGCSGCCTGPVFVHIDEMEAIVARATDAQLVEAGRLHDALQVLMDRVQAPPTREGYRTTVKMKATKAESRAALDTLAYRCPLLDPEGRCTVYAVRPLVCRGFGVSSDPKHCSDHSGKAVIPPEVEHVRNSVLSQTPLGHLDRAGIDTIVGVLAAEQERRAVSQNVTQTPSR